LSVIVPVHDAARDLAFCIDALAASTLPRESWELLIVCDSSSAATRAIAAQRADKVIALADGPRGPAFARNRGVEASRASIVAFIDADVMVHPDALKRLLSAFDQTGVAAAFGSYDDSPSHEGMISEYRNLLHHRVHQKNAGSVESFWAGCGAVRKQEFRAVGGFDESRYDRPAIEDVELGYRLRDRNFTIVLDPEILCTHRKRWTLGSMVTSDFSQRGVPWTRLLVQRRMLFSPRGLSLGASERASVISAFTFVLLVTSAAVSGNKAIAIAALAAFAAFLYVNRDLFSWLSRVRGVWFAARATVLHLLYSVLAMSAFAYGSLTSLISQRERASYTPTQ
jgi:cellulose synthase/poly-beta-1,6-N-acetylglucosamine synthase-like glycosyltransferase